MHGYQYRHLIGCNRYTHPVGIVQIAIPRRGGKKESWNSSMPSRGLGGVMNQPFIFSCHLLNLHASICR